MTRSDKYIIGTSGYSFADWVGPFYPEGTRSKDMFAHYVKAFGTVELNFTYYRMPTAQTLDKLNRVSPQGFTFWVKANQETTHKQNRQVAAEFLENLRPLIDSGKLAGVLFQFPQSFHRTVAGRKYLAAALEDFAAVPRAVEFRHHSWNHPSTIAGLQDRGVTLVVPDVPDLPGLFRIPAAVTSPTGYLRLHSRDAAKWYDPSKDRYDYSYTPGELAEILDEWRPLEDGVDRVFTFFNNCHGGQAAQNAEAFRRLLEEDDAQ